MTGEKCDDKEIQVKLTRPILFRFVLTAAHCLPQESQLNITVLLGKIRLF